MLLGIPIVEVSTEYNISTGSSRNCHTNTVCLYPGNNITINCISSEIYNISGPGGVHQDHSLMITLFSYNKVGVYMCSSSNLCGETISTISLSMISEYWLTLYILSTSFHLQFPISLLLVAILNLLLVVKLS